MQDNNVLSKDDLEVISELLNFDESVDLSVVLSLDNCAKDKTKYLDVINNLYSVDLLIYMASNKKLMTYTVTVLSESLSSSTSDLENLLMVVNRVMKESKSAYLPKVMYERNTDGLCFVDIARAIVPSHTIDKVCVLYAIVTSMREHDIDFDLAKMSSYSLVRSYIDSIYDLKIELDNAEKEIVSNPCIETICKFSGLVSYLHSSLGTLRNHKNFKDALFISNLISCIRVNIPTLGIIPSLIIKYFADKQTVDDKLSVTLEDSNAEKRKRIVNDINYYKQFLSDEELNEIEEMYS